MTYLYSCLSCHGCVSKRVVSRHLEDVQLWYYGLCEIAYNMMSVIHKYIL